MEGCQTVKGFGMKVNGFLEDQKTESNQLLATVQASLDPEPRLLEEPN
jgi:hypothetical protein